MADSRHTLVLLLLGIASAAAAGASTLEEQKTFFLPPGALNPGKITKCWSSVLNSTECSRELLRSFLNGRFWLGPECCKVIDKIEQSCFIHIFANAPFNPFFPPVLKSFCGKAPSLNLPVA